MLQGCLEVGVYEQDIEYSMRPESFFYYLFGLNENNTIGAINLSTGRSCILISDNLSFYVKTMNFDEIIKETKVETSYFYKDL